MITAAERAEYNAWAKWVAAGRLPAKRPKTVRKAIPKSWWDEYRRTHPPKPKPPVDLSAVRNVCFFATVTDDALTAFRRLPPRWKAAFTADDAYPVTSEQVATVKLSGHQAFGWCDCRTTYPAKCKEFVTKLGLAGWYGQAESPAEFDVGYAGGARAMIVNLSALRSDQLLRIRTAEVVVTNEVYLNVHPWEKPDWKSVNAGVGGNAGAVYASYSEGAKYTPVSEQPREWFSPFGSWYVESFTAEDWDVLRTL